MTMALPRPEDRPTLTVSEAAQVLGVSRSALYKLVLSGDVPSLKIGARRLVPTAGLRRLVQIDQ